jgi:SNF2 family DNA or RNA helicase
MKDFTLDSMPMIPQPTDMKQNLYPHPLCAVKMMENLEEKKNIMTTSYHIDTNMGIYSDLIGYGKTLTMVALILRDINKFHQKETFVKEIISGVFGNGVIVKKTMLNYQKINATLIICSASIVKQWKEEILSTPLRFITIFKKKILDNFTISDFDIVICLPSFYNGLIDRFSNYAWKRLVYDEPTHTKIKCMKFPTCQFLWLISSTPYDLLNKSPQSNHFLSNVFSNCMDLNTLRNIIIKNKDEFVKKSFEMPSIHHLYYECYQPLLFLVRDLISFHIAEMISAGNIEKAIKQLGGNSTSNVYELVISEKKEELAMVKCKIEKYVQHEDDEKIIKWQEKFATITRQLQECEERFKDVLLNACNICLSTLKEPVFITCCQNIFCGNCFFCWMKSKKTCPICRNNVSSDMITYIQTNNESTLETPKRKKNKQETLLEILESNSQGKYIIFSNYDETFQNIRDLLDDEKISFTEIKGCMETREKQLESFKLGQKNVLFLNSLTNGAGINIQEATDIILYHKMSEDIQSQVIGRAYRIGRKDPLNVHHLI